jgi:hypothetical protein
MSRPIAARHSLIAPRFRRPALSVICTLCFAYVWGCSSENPAPNRPPTVQLTAGPTEGDTVRYNIPISWSGEDPDGSIIRYEYTIDPDSSFTEDEVANGGPGIVSKTIKGQNGDPDTTRVTKDSGTAFDWIHTRETSHRFEFSTPVADPLTLRFTGRFFGMHALYVRAVDNDQAASIPDKVAFTARTIAPTSTILRPRAEATPLILGDSLRATWTGRDPDGRSRHPKGFYYALAHPKPIICIPEECSPYLFLYDATWTFVPGTVTSFVFPLEVPSNYIFAIRAVDESGAIEPFLDWQRNAIYFGTRASALQPLLSVAYEGQVLTFPSGASGSFELQAGREALIELSCSAESYGESCDGFRWGLDLPDLEDWPMDWSSTAQIRLTVPRAGMHVLYVEARDNLGNITLGNVILRAVDFSFEREVLLVDDSLDYLSPTDSEHDAFWRDMVSYYVANSNVPADQFGEIAVFGDGDRNLEPAGLSLSDLAKYKAVVWENLGSGYNADSGLYRAAAASSLLAKYLKAGGKLWLDGRMTVGATTAGYGGADLSYPKTELGPGDFAWDFLKLHSSKINNDKGNNSSNFFHAARSFPGMPAVYDTMSVDPGKLRIFQQSIGGFYYADAVFDPNYAESEPDFKGDIDTLYAYGAAGPEVLGKTSQYHNKLCAIRWHDPDPDREHGRIQWFGFSLYFMHQDQARQTFKASLDWLRQESPGP